MERFEGQALALATGLQQDIERDVLGMGFRGGDTADLLVKDGVPKGGTAVSCFLSGKGCASKCGY